MAMNIVTLRPKVIAGSAVIFVIAVAVIVTNSVITYNLNEITNPDKTGDERQKHLDVAYQWAWTSDIVAMILAGISGIIGGVAIGSYVFAP